MVQANARRAAPEPAGPAVGRAGPLRSPASAAAPATKVHPTLGLVYVSLLGDFLLTWTAEGPSYWGCPMGRGVGQVEGGWDLEPWAPMPGAGPEGTALWAWDFKSLGF